MSGYNNNFATIKDRFNSKCLFVSWGRMPSSSSSSSFGRVSTPGQTKTGLRPRVYPFATLGCCTALIRLGILEHRDQQLILAIYVRRATAKLVSKVVRSFEIFRLKVKRILVVI